jgi:hypothetical protein
MAIIELIVPHPNAAGRTEQLSKLDEALNQGYTIVDCHSIDGKRLYLLHKQKRGERYIPHPDSPHR